MQWRLAVSAYAPTLLASIGFGAVIPLIAIQATHLGASTGLAALISGLSGVATLMFDLPAGVIAPRLGEKYSIIVACLVDAGVMVAVFFAGSLEVLSLACVLHGMTGSIFGLARQTYLTQAIPLRYRARAMSTLGGVFRVGGFFGPLIASALLARGEVRDAFVFSAAMSVCAAIVTLFLPDLPEQESDKPRVKARTFTVLRTHRRTLLTVGMGCFALMAVRATRQTIIPLWGQANGLDPAFISLLYSLSMAMDVALFYPGGWIMDRFGRWFVCVPSLFAMSICLIILPAAHTPLTIGLVAACLGLGNGVSSGIVMTLGADFAPRFATPQFLAGWRLICDTGQSSGPLIVAGVTSIATLGAGSVVVGALGILGGLWLGRWVPKKPATL